MIGKINDNYIFLKTIDDLKNKIRENHYCEYDLVRACGLLRHIFIDENRLIDKVNIKPFKTSILFNVENYNNHSDLFQGSNRIQLLPISKTTHKIKLNLFLRLKVYKSEEHEYTVCEIIKSITTYWGGIHSVNAYNEKDIVLKGIDKLIYLDYIQVFLCIIDICKICLEAIKPLEIKLRPLTILL